MVSIYLKDDVLLDLKTKIEHRSDINEKVNTLNDFLDKASNNCLMKLKIFKDKSGNKKKKIKQKAFDKNCYDKRRNLKRIGELLNKYPNNDNIRKTYHQNKKEYKYLMKNRIREEKEKELRKL